MPTDVTGTDVIEEDITTGHRTWTFVPGPIFANVLLADEINRTPPKTQSALLEAMQELTVTVRGDLHEIDPPFFVLATQNPIELEGTYPLPEAQLDRFLFNVILDYLDDDEELAVVDRYTTRMDIPAVDACTGPEEIVRFQSLVRQVPVAESVSRFAVELVRATRPTDPAAPEVVKRYVQYGASVRATMFLTLAAKARALMAGPLPRHPGRHLRAGAAGHAPPRADQLLRRIRQGRGGRRTPPTRGLHARRGACRQGRLRRTRGRFDRSAEQDSVEGLIEAQAGPWMRLKEARAVLWLR